MRLLPAHDRSISNHRHKTRKKSKNHSRNCDAMTEEQSIISAEKNDDYTNEHAMVVEKGSHDSNKRRADLSARLLDALDTLENVTQNANLYMKELSNNDYDEVDQSRDEISREDRKKGTKREKNLSRVRDERENLHNEVIKTKKELYPHIRNKKGYQKKSRALNSELSNVESINSIGSQRELCAKQRDSLSERIRAIRMRAITSFQEEEAKNQMQVPQQTRDRNRNHNSSMPNGSRGVRRNNRLEGNTSVFDSSLPGGKLEVRFLDFLSSLHCGS